MNMFGTPHLHITLRRGVLAIVGAIVFVAGGVDALVVRHPDGTYANGCGVAHFHEFDESGIRLAKSAARVTLQHSYASPRGWFRIHYDATGTRAVPPADTNGNGVPDWVELVADIADSIRQGYYDLGYDRSLNDGGAGGGVEYDIYLLNLASQGYYGLTYSGDGYMQLDNDFAESIYQVRGADAVRVTLAHEMFHAIQFTYWIGDRDGVWWQEATATFMEDVFYPDINDYWQYLNPDWFTDTLFEDPTLSLHYDSGGRDAHMYGASLFCHFLDQSDPARGHAAIRKSYERQATQRSDNIDVIIGAVEQEMNRPIGQLVAEFWIWNYFTGWRHRPGVFYRDAAGYAWPPPNQALEADWTVRNLSEIASVERTESARNLGASMTRIVPDRSSGGIRLSMTANDLDTPWSWNVAVVDPDTIRVLSAVDGQIEIDNWDATTDIVVIGANGRVASQLESARTFSLTVTYDPTLTRPTPDRFDLALEQNRPNPFNPVTMIPFTVNSSARITLRIYDINGRVVRTLLDNVPYGPGKHTVSWEGNTDTGRRVAAGVYIARITAQDATQTIRMTLLR